MKNLIIILAIIFLSGCSWNVGYVKQQAEKKWNELGYEIIGYEGYQWSHEGGVAYYCLKRKDVPGVIFTGGLSSWFGELQVYGPKAINRKEIK